MQKLLTEWRKYLAEWSLRTNNRTRGEQAEFEFMQRSKEWIEQLSPVKYRQLLEDISAVTDDEFNELDQWTNTIRQAVRDGGLYKETRAWEREMKENPKRLGRYVQDSGYPEIPPN